MRTENRRDKNNYTRFSVNINLSVKIRLFLTHIYSEISQIINNQESLKRLCISHPLLFIYCFREKKEEEEEWDEDEEKEDEDAGVENIFYLL